MRAVCFACDFMECMIIFHWSNCKLNAVFMARSLAALGLTRHAIAVLRISARAGLLCGLSSTAWACVWVRAREGAAGGVS